MPHNTQDKTTSELRDILISVASELGADIKFVNDNTSSFSSCSGILTIEGIKIGFSYLWYSDKKFNFSMSYEGDTDRVTMLLYDPYPKAKTPEINASPSKPVKQIAKQIKTKLLTEDFKSNYKTMKDCYLQGLEDKEKHKENIQVVCDILGVKNTHRAETKEIRSNEKQLSVRINSSRYSLNLEDLNLEEIKAILKLVGRD